VVVKAQTYTTIANGPWANASTWQGGSIPDPTNILAGTVINIKHTVTGTSGGTINNYGTININNAGGLSPRLIIPSGVTLNNFIGGKVTIINAEIRQYRYIGGGETGTPQSGSFINAGGIVEITNSFLEIAGGFENKNGGIRKIINSSIVLGTDFKANSNSNDTLISTSISAGWFGAGTFDINGGYIYFQSVRIEVANPSGGFKISGSVANGDIDYITLKNHVTNIVSNGTITASASVVSSGLNLDAYYVSSPANYISNSKFSGTQTLIGTLDYFPAGLFDSLATTPTFNLGFAPNLISGTDLQPGAIYKFESATPGVDVYVKIDSFVNGASLNKIDDNSGGLGYLEGFQPEVKSGPTTGTSYVAFKIEFKVSGTLKPYLMSRYNITALDIDGNANLNEFDQITLDPSATAAYLTSTSNIAISNWGAGSYKGLNISNAEKSGIDTGSIANMFTLQGHNVSSFTVKVGAVKSFTTQESRQYGIYFKGFDYQNAPLPVKLVSFNAALNTDGKNVDLLWVTAQEINVKNYIVQRSTDGYSFENICTIQTVGNSSTNLNHYYTDLLNKNISPVLYYRICTVDTDGKISYSGTQVVSFKVKQSDIIVVHAFPNPFTNEIQITAPASWKNNPVLYQVINTNGQTVKSSLNVNNGQTETIPTAQLAAGVYIIKATSQGKIAVQKIIKK
jgi:hypothetical protein